MTQDSLGVDVRRAQEFLARNFPSPPTEICLIGAGAWSRCFGFRVGDQELAIRFGRHVEDFEKDRMAYGYAGPHLPIPEVQEIGVYEDGFFAISTRVHGIPLEQVDAEGWRAIVPSLVTAMEAMRLADISHTSGLGGWGADGNAPWTTWSQWLLSVEADTPDRRDSGWRTRLADGAPEEHATFEWGHNLLQKVVGDTIPRSLLHRDLINRNVMVDGARISGIFDWGCSGYGDHLYELAWFDFWAPWFPQLDIALLRRELESRWQESGYAPADVAERLLACTLHIGLEHLAYNAYLGDWPALSATAAQMKELVRQRS